MEGSVLPFDNSSFLMNDGCSSAQPMANRAHLHKYRLYILMACIFMIVLASTSCFSFYGCIASLVNRRGFILNHGVLITRSAAPLS